MAEKSFPLENTMYTAADAQLWFATRTSGVYAGHHLGVTANGTLDLTLGPGIAWLAYSEFGGCVYANTQNLTKTAEMSDAQYDRYDRLCVRVDILNNRVYSYIKKGTAASSPIPPEMQRDNVAYEISVYKIFRGVGSTGINAGDITDERLDSSVCGLMRDGVTGIDTSVISAQVTALINELQRTLQAVYDGVEKVNILETSATLLATGWSAEEPYEQTIAVDGLLNSDNPFVDVDMSGTFTADDMKALTAAWAGVLKATAGANTVTVYMSTAPDVDVPIKIKVVN